MDVEVDNHGVFCERQAFKSSRDEESRERGVVKCFFHESESYDAKKGESFPRVCGQGSA